MNSRNDRRSRPIPRRSRRGVTLMEALATMILIAIVLPAVMQGISISLRAASHARQMSEASQLAETKLNELLVQRDAALLSGSGDFGADWPEYRWQSTATAGDLDVYQLTVTVTWTERGRERSVSLATLVYPTGLTVS